MKQCHGRKLSPSPGKVRQLGSTPRRARAALVAAAALLIAAPSLPAAQVRLREGTLVLLKLRDNITTENALKGDRIEFDVAENVLVNNLLAIPKGAVAWGEVTRVRSGGKKSSKVTGFVAFQVKGVHTADNQQIGLRKAPERPRKPKPEENDYQEASVIRGLRERMIGAEKGKEYAAYTDQEIVVNAPEAVAAPTAGPAAAPAAPTVASPAAATPAASSPSAPASPTSTPSTPTPNAPATLSKELLEPEKGSIDFASDPTGADIVIDGSFVGNTPSTLRVTPGRHTIELRSPSYQPWTRTMLVGPGSHPSIRAFLEKENK